MILKRFPALALMVSLSIKYPFFLTRSLKVGQLSAVRSEHAVAEVPLQAIAAFCDFSLKIIDEELLIKS